MVLSSLANLSVGFFDLFEISVPREIGLVFLALGSLFFVYVLSYLRRDSLERPNRDRALLSLKIDRSPLWSLQTPAVSELHHNDSIDRLVGSLMGIILTLALSIPSAV